jgi:hypothetical protein
MKTSKSVGKTKTTTRNKDSIGRNESSTRKSRPSEEDIRVKAEDLYHQRIDRGENGTAENDWLSAENYLIESEEF